MDQENPRNLPAFLRPLFWDCDFHSLEWEAHQDFIIRRILQAGDWEAINWLRKAMGGNTVLKRWIEQRRGGGLSPRQLRFWGLVLDIPRPKVNRWVEKTRNELWEQRVGQ